MGQNLIFYTISGTIVAALMQWAGFNWGEAMFGSLIVPPILLIAWKIAQFKGMV